MNRPDIVLLDTSTLDGALACWALRQAWPDINIASDVPKDGEPLGIMVIANADEKALLSLAEHSRWLFVCGSANLGMLSKLRDDGLLKFAYDSERSACVFAWYYAMGEGRPLPRLLQYVQAAKLGSEPEENADWPSIMAAASSYDTRDHAVLTDLVKRCEDPGARPVLIAEGRAIMRYVERRG